MGKFNAEKVNKLKWPDRIFRALYFSPKNKKTLPQIVKSDVSEIVIIAMFMIGDTIMSIPALKVLKRNFPAAKITLICGGTVEVILQGQGLADKFVVVNCPWITKNYSLKNVVNFFAALKTVNKTKYDLAIDFRGDWRNIVYMNFINSYRKVSFNYTGGDYMLTNVIEPESTITHYIDEWLYLLKQIGCAVKGDDRFPVLKLTKEDENTLAGFKLKNGLDKGFVIGIHPGASMEARKWGELKYAQLLTRLSVNHNFKFVIFEGPDERDTVKKIEDYLTTAGVGFVVVKGNLKNYLTLINCCGLLICNDSGAGHIAGAFGIPSVIIFGKAVPEIVMPFNKNYLSIISHLNNPSVKPGERDDKGYLDSITVDEVFIEAENLINKLKARPENLKSNDVIK